MSTWSRSLTPFMRVVSCCTRSRAATVIAQLCVGDAVTFNANVRPRYLAHELAVITDLDEHWVTVRLARSVGRFRDRELRCPPLALRKVARIGSQPAA